MHKPRFTVFAAFAAIAFASLAHAGPDLAYWQNLSGVQEISELKQSDKVLFVCTACKSASEVSLTSHEDVVKLHTAEGEVVCPGCKKKLKIIHRAYRDQPAKHTEVVYVDDQGKEVAFLVKAK